MMVVHLVPTPKRVLQRAKDLTKSYGLTKGWFAVNAAGNELDITDTDNACAYCIVGFLHRAVRDLGVADFSISTRLVQKTNRVVSEHLGVDASMWNDLPDTSLLKVRRLFHVLSRH
jgi:hypothetical protein